MESQRDAFFNSLFELAKEDERIIVITADCGAPSLDRWREELPNQIINVGIAEQQMIALAAGLALSGKRPYCYAITPFATLRCYEFIKVDICLMNLPVVIVGLGAGFSYNESGPTHHATEDISIMRVLPNMTVYNVSDSAMAGGLAADLFNSPTYIRLDRLERRDFEVKQLSTKPNLISFGFPLEDFNRGFISRTRVRMPIIIGTGAIVHNLIQTSANVIDIFRLKPINVRRFLFHLEQCKKQAKLLDQNSLCITIEEHLLAGGLGSIIAEIFADNNINIPLKRIGINDEYFHKYGSREDIWDGEAELSSLLKSA